MTNQNQRTVTLMLGIIAIVTTIAALKYGSPVILPILIALFLAAVVQPIMQKLNAFLPKYVSLVVLLLLLGSVMTISSLLFVTNVQGITEKVPEYAKKAEHMSTHLFELVKSQGIDLKPRQLGTQKSMSWLIRFMSSGLTSVFSMAGQLFLVMFILIFLSLEINAFQHKLHMALGFQQGGKVRSTLTSIIQRIQTYAFAKTMISLLTGACTWLVASLFSLDFPFFWGMLAFLLNFIPTIGSMIAVIPPTMLAFLQFAGWKSGVGLFVGLASTQVLIGNVLEPRLMGRSMNLSPLVVFLSMLFWGWLWGITGMVMAIPLTVGIKITCEHIERLQPVAIFLGDFEGSTATAQQLGFTPTSSTKTSSTDDVSAVTPATNEFASSEETTEAESKEPKESTKSKTSAQPSKKNEEAKTGKQKKQKKKHK